MVLSIVGSAFLLKPLTKSVSAEGESISGLPANLKFTAATATGDATDYNSTDGYIYSGYSLNYINANSLIYYYNTANGKMYSDPEYKNEAKDIKFNNYDNTNNTIKISKANEDAYSTYAIHSDVYTFLYKNIRYFFKDGTTYTDANCTVSTNISHTIQFEISVAAVVNSDSVSNEIDSIIELTTGTKYYSGISPITLYNIGGYYGTNDTNSGNTDS